MTRVIAGTVGGRRLRTPPGVDTRPTADRVREALFSSLGDVSGLRVLDLYAGSGALGLEAASRGAASVVLVENASAALRALRRNVEDLGLPATVVGRDVLAFLAESSPDPATRFDLVLADPPYRLDADPLLAALPRCLAPGATVVLERAWRSPAPVPPAVLAPLRSRRYGDAALWYFRVS